MKSLARRWAGGAGLLGTLLLATLPVLEGSPAAAQEKPLRIGGLWLGPRKAPTVQCGARGLEPAPAEGAAPSLPPDALGFRDELQKLGYVEERPENAGKPGRRFVLDVRMGGLEEVKRYAQQFAQERVDLILATPTLPVRAAQEATRANPIPILFTAVSDPVRDGFVQSLSRPGGWITGISTQLIQGSGKRVEIFKEMLPGARRLLTIYKPDFLVAQRSMVEVRKAAADVGITMVERHANNRQEVQAALADVRRESVDGILFAVDAVLVSNADLVLEVALRERVPTFGILDYMADWGALASYGPSPYQAGRRAAHYLDKIVKGGRPADLPVEPLDPTFAINLKAASRCYGVSVSPALLHQADRVIR